MFNGADPGGVQDALAQAQAKGLNAGIWLVPGDNESPQSFAQRLASFSSLDPSLVVPDLEFIAKGYPGSPGYQWTQDFADTYRQLAPDQQLGVTVMPNQADFNYQALLNAGATTFLPQAYGATYDQQFDPNQVVQTLVDAGVPIADIAPVLAPGQYYSGGPFGEYTLDDQSQATLAWLSQWAKANPQQAAQVVQASQTQPQTVQPTPVPHETVYGKPLDFQNPKAVKYATAGLARLKSLGYTPDQFGLQGEDVTAQYRDLSPILGALASNRAGAQYQIPQTILPDVASVIPNLTAAGFHPKFSLPKQPGTPTQAAPTLSTPQPVNPNVNAPYQPPAVPIPVAGTNQQEYHAPGSRLRML